MKGIPVTLESAMYLGTKTERFGDKESTMAMFLIGVDSVPLFVPGNMMDEVSKYEKMKPGFLKAEVTFRDSKPGGYFVLRQFLI